MMVESQGRMMAELDPDQHHQSNDSANEGEDHVLMGERQGSRNGRIYKKANWQVNEVLVLQAARKEDEDRQLKGGPKEKHKTAQERWQAIEDHCWAHSVQRSAQQCQDKWESIGADFKKVKDYERGVISGQKSYWDMTNDDRKKKRLPPNFHREVYNALGKWFIRSRAVDPSDLLVDTSTPAGATAAGGSHNVVGSPGDQSDLEAGNDAENGLATGKKRKFTPKAPEGIASLMEKNNGKLIAVLQEAEERKDKRHKDFITITSQLGTGYIAALNNIGDGLKRLSDALQAGKSQ